MKPLKLTMCAFGSYAGEETLNFTDIGEKGLYLITGKTGSGKTTIFDAISYALFGKASGSARNSYTMLRSDYADAHTETFVDLEFLSGGSLYRVRREITPHISRKTEEVTYTDSTSLILGDGTILATKRDVDAKIIDVIGLNRDQFAQIVMIAQNDFLRFLHSGTEDRVHILRRIFGTEALKSFQEKLKVRVKEKSDERKAVIREFEKHNVDLYRHDEQFVKWEQQIQDDEEAVKQADVKLGAYDAVKEALAGRIAVAEGLNKSFADLDMQRQALETHTAKQDAMTALAGQKRRGETALRNVRPYADKAAETERSYKTAKADLEKAVSEEQEAKRILEQAKKTLSELPPLETAQAMFDKLRSEWEQTESKLKKLTVIEDDYNSVVQKQTALDTLATELTEVEETIQALPSVAEAQSALDALRLNLTECTEKQTDLTSLKNSFDIIRAKQHELSEEQTEFETLTLHYKTAKARYDELYERFLRGQAGLLARSLEAGRACPVCGSTEHPAPAPAPDEDISESRLKELNTESDKAKGELDDKTAQCAGLQGEITTLIEGFLRDGSKWFSALSLESIDSVLAETIIRTGQNIAGIRAAIAADENGLSERISAAEKLTKRREEIAPQCTTLRAEIDTLTERLLKDFREHSPDTIWDSAENDIITVLDETKTHSDELTVKKNADEPALADLKKKLDAAAKAYTESEAKRSSARTLVVERESRVKEHITLNDTAQAVYQDALAANGFADEAAYTESLITEDELAGLTKSLSDYEEKGSQIKRDITRLESETSDKEKPDIEKLNAEAAKIKTSVDVLRSGRDEIISRFDTMTRIVKELKTSAAALEIIDKDFAALKGLSDTANGRLDFETYAQMAYFERVLRAANIRLKVMSQNRYVLLRREEGRDGRKRTGLEIEVADSYTGKSRSANSLSGGESFMASLSLALGLSDVVQQRAGGVHLDAMFIDEGFGSLDTEVLELSVRTLSDMAEGSRIIGIISHVAELRERIDKQVCVEKTTAGSKIRLVL